MVSLRECVVERYKNKDQLIEKGIWGGEIYRECETDDLVASRGWIWKIMLVNDELLNYDLVPLSTAHSDKVLVVRSPTERRQNSIRQLTPVRLQPNASHPLQIHSNDNDDDDNDSKFSLEDCLDIIELDVSRLVLDPIFRDPKVHDQIKLIMYNYLLRNCQDEFSEKLSYQQGYHEILGVIYLQLYKSEETLQSINVLEIFTKLMSEVKTIFYNKQRIITWEHGKFSPILRICAPSSLYAKFYCTDTSADEFINLLWLVRWTRLLLIRELPLDYVLIIWDHILTFQYPVDTFIACIIVVMIIAHTQFLTKMDDHDSVIEYMTNFRHDKSISTRLDCLELCDIAGNLCELWYMHKYEQMTNLIRQKFYPKTMVLDPNRQRLEGKLRERVRRTIAHQR